jgi:hypothetical protein
VASFAGSSVVFTWAAMAEPFKLYGPHTSIIVLKISDCYAWETNNFGSLSGVLGEPRIIHDSTFRRIITEDIAILQQSIQIYYIKIEEWKYYKS